MNNWKSRGYNIFVGVVLSILTIGLIMSIAQENNFKKIVIDTNEFINLQLDEIREQQNRTLLHDIQLDIYLKQLSKAQNITEEDINKLQQVNLVNINKLLDSSLSVQGLDGSGSGTIIKKTENSMYILTCAHVVADIYEANQNGFEFGASVGYFKYKEDNSLVGVIAYEAEIIKYDKENDLALLKTSINDETLREVKIAEQEPIIGDVVYSIGNPIGLIRVISKGILSNKIKDFYVSDNTTTFGNSGGGLFNENTELIGVPAQVMVYIADAIGVAPESSLGMSRNLRTINNFLKDITYE